MQPKSRTTARAALAAGILMTVGTQGEWVLDPQLDDGTIANMPVFAMLLVVATSGFALLTAAVLGLLRTMPDPPNSAARVGGAITVAGAGLLTLFGLSTLISALVSETAWEPAFIAFLLGMLVLAAGCLTWALSLRHHATRPGVWQTLLAIGVLALAALLIEPDPWHDVSLVGMFTGWSLLGILMLRTPRTIPQTRGSTPRTISAL